MKNYYLLSTLLLLVGSSQGNDTPFKADRPGTLNTSHEHSAKNTPSYRQKYLDELKGNAPWFVSALATNYLITHLQQRMQDHTLNIASAALISPFCKRFIVFPGLMMGGLETDPNRAHTVNAFKRLDKAAHSRTIKRSSIRPLVYGLGTSLLTGTALRLFSQEAVGEAPSLTKVAASIAAGLIIPALLVQADELAEQPQKITPTTGTVSEHEGLVTTKNSN